MEAIYKYMIHNGHVVNVMDIPTGSENSVYEVVRIIEKPVYLKEHVVRLNKSLKLLGADGNVDYEDIKLKIKELSSLNNIYINNVKILCTIKDKHVDNVYIYHIKSSYPDESVYDIGVKTILYDIERENPHIKIYRPKMKEMINKELQSHGAYEAILTDNNGYVTEGSRSNLLFIKGNKVVTAKKDKVLLGVTREKVIEVCEKNSVGYIEKDIKIQDLKDFDAAFLTGTSINILPIKSIEDQTDFDVKNRLLIDLMEYFEKDYMK